MAWLAAITYWHWWLLGALLALIELAMPSGASLWLGIAAGVTGLVLLAQPGLGWVVQLLLFVTIAAVGTTLWRLRQRRRRGPHDVP